MTGNQIDSAEHQSLLRRKAETQAGPDHKEPVHPLLTLQSQIGNAQVARLLAQREAEEEAPVQASHDLSLQREGDEDELAAKHDLSLQREGDEDELAAKHDLSVQREGDEDELAAKHDTSVQREGDDELQASHDERVGIEGGPVGPDTAQRISSSRGGGSALDGGTRSSMESAFGTSFQDVRVHHDSESDVLNRRLTSHAFTTGSDIFLRGDSSPSDNHLMAHELTHVVQQRSMGGGSGMSVGAAGDPHEQHADSVADSVLSNSAAPAAEAPAAQREGAEEEEVAASHDLSVQREGPEEEEVQASHDLSVQREGPEEEEVAASHDLSVQREAPEEEEVAASHDLSLQREAVAEGDE